MKSNYFIKVLLVFVVPLVVSLPSQAFMQSWYDKSITLEARNQIYAEYGYGPGPMPYINNIQNVSETIAQNSTNAEAILVTVPSAAVRPPDSSPFIPDGPEKQERVKKLLREIQDTNGFEFGRELSIFYGPTVRKLYTLHKKLTTSDWQLLAEMYVSFIDSNEDNIAGTSVKSDDNPENVMKLDTAMEMLLAMHGEASIDIINAMVADASHQQPKYKKSWRGFEIYNKSWQGHINFIKDKIKSKVWSDLPEYKKDQQ